MYRAAAIFLLFNNVEREIEENRQRRLRFLRQLKIQRKVLRDMSNAFEMPPQYFRQFYRLTPEVAFNLVRLLEVQILRQGASYIPVHLQVLCALRFFAEGCFQKGASQDFQHPVSQPTFSRCLGRVVNALCSIAQEWIRLPRTKEERQAASARFLNHNRIHGILGLVDCTVVKLIRPPVNEEAFYNHEHKHSLNVQVVCGENKVIFDIRICPGSNNDRNIWKYSDVRNHMRSLRSNDQIVEEEGHYYILGDSGYTPSPILLTPIRNAAPGSSEALYTHDHCHTRCIIEQVFGDENNTYLCISRKRILHYRPRKASKIILACAVLHNFKLLHGIRREEDAIVRNEALQRPNALRVEENDYEAGLITRVVLVNTYYRA